MLKIVFSNRCAQQKKKSLFRQRKTARNNASMTRNFIRLAT